MGDMTDTLKTVEIAARKANEAHQALEEAIEAAYESGQPLRAIAKAAGISHEQVRRIYVGRS